MISIVHIVGLKVNVTPWPSNGEDTMVLNGPTYTIWSNLGYIQTDSAGEMEEEVNLLIEEATPPPLAAPPGGVWRPLDGRDY